MVTPMTYPIPHPNWPQDTDYKLTNWKPYWKLVKYIYHSDILLHQNCFSFRENELLRQISKCAVWQLFVKHTNLLQLVVVFSPKSWKLIVMKPSQVTFDINRGLECTPFTNLPYTNTLHEFVQLWEKTLSGNQYFLVWRNFFAECVIHVRKYINLSKT